MESDVIQWVCKENLNRTVIRHDWKIKQAQLQAEADRLGCLSSTDV